MQIWNVNAHTGIVGVFNLQGSSWDRTRRQYFVHDATPPTLDVVVRPRDIEPFRSLQLQAAGSETSSSSSPGSSSQTPSFACYSNQSQGLMRLKADEGCLVELSGTPFMSLRSQDLHKDACSHDNTLQVLFALSNFAAC